LGLVPVQVSRSGDCYFEALATADPQRVARFLGYDGDVLVGDMRDVVAQMRQRLVDRFVHDLEQNTGNYDVLGVVGSDDRAAGVERLIDVLGTVGRWTEDDGLDDEAAPDRFDVGDVVPQVVARLMNIPVEQIDGEGRVSTRWQGGDGAAVRLVRVLDPVPHYLATVASDDRVLDGSDEYSEDRFREVILRVRRWLVETTSERIEDVERPGEVRDLILRLDGTDELRRQRTRLRDLVDAVRQWRQAVHDAPYLQAAMEGLYVSRDAVINLVVPVLAAARAYAELRSLITAHEGQIMEVRAGWFTVEGQELRFGRRPADGTVRLVSRPAVGSTRMSDVFAASVPQAATRQVGTRRAGTWPAVGDRPARAALRVGLDRRTGQPAPRCRIPRVGARTTVAGEPDRSGTGPLPRTGVGGVASPSGQGVMSCGIGTSGSRRAPRPQWTPVSVT
jgi:hypothetical protein